MALETGTFISDLVATNPVGSDPLAFADDHIRLVKSTIKNTFPNISGAVTRTHTDINNLATQANLTALESTLNTAIANAVAAARQNAYPVGSIYINATNGTNPASLLGFGTWVAFGAGRVPVGFDGGDALFNAPEKTGGSKDAVLVDHAHSFSATTGGQSADHTHVGGNTTEFGIGAIASAGHTSNQGVNSLGKRFVTSGTSNDHTHSVSGTTSSAGSSATNANVQPYITVFMWKRTA